MLANETLDTALEFKLLPFGAAVSAKPAAENALDNHAEANDTPIWHFGQGNDYY
ncbi:MAG TPA: hypothetical protein VJ464_19115 [Blastocatellia bacterium]|nr:hypothetical protein [Blastocatellia bacterium]